MSFQLTCKSRVSHESPTPTPTICMKLMLHLLHVKSTLTTQINVPYMWYIVCRYYCSINKRKCSLMPSHPRPLVENIWWYELNSYHKGVSSECIMIVQRMQLSELLECYYDFMTLADIMCCIADCSTWYFY